MTISASVAIVSHGRPGWLDRALLSIRLQTHARFETLVVADHEPQLPKEMLPPNFRFLRFDQRNISAARNLALASANGEVIAFMDDDAIADTAWLERLVAPFNDSGVAAAGGLTRGRNGISLQYRGGTINADGSEAELHVSQTCVYSPASGVVPKTTGTNCAFRLSALKSLGGFDENFRYYLEDADANLRLAANGYTTSMVPDAQVQHLSAAGLYRGKDKVLTSLHEIAASQAYFLIRHCPANERQDALQRFETRHRKRIESWVSQGALNAAGKDALVQSMQAGFEDGLTRVHKKRLFPVGHSDAPPAEHSTPDHVVIFTGLLKNRRAHKRAKELSQSGSSVTVVELRPSPRFMQASFNDDGYWHHLGGDLRQGGTARKILYFQRC